MAERVDTFEFKKRGGSTRRYPWTDWADGSIWKLQKGVDFDIEIDSFRASIATYARTHELEYRTTVVKEDDKVFMFIQFTPKS